MGICFVVLTWDEIFKNRLKEELYDEDVAFTDNVESLRDVFKRDFLNIFIVDVAAGDLNYCLALSKASFFPARVNTYLVSYKDGHFTHEGVVISELAAYFKERAL